MEEIQRGAWAAREWRVKQLRLHAAECVSRRSAVPSYVSSAPVPRHTPNARSNSATLFPLKNVLYVHSLKNDKMYIVALCATKASPVTPSSFSRRVVSLGTVILFNKVSVAGPGVWRYG